MLVALVGRSEEGLFAVQFLTDAAAAIHTRAVDAGTEELDFYLGEKGEPDPWPYVQHHCGTSANIYSSVHWSFFPAGWGPCTEEVGFKRPQRQFVGEVAAGDGAREVRGGSTRRRMAQL